MFLRWKAPIFPICQHGTEVSTKWNRNYPLATRAHFYTGQALYVRSARRTARTLECPAVLRHTVPNKGLHPLLLDLSGAVDRLDKLPQRIRGKRHQGIRISYDLVGFIPEEELLKQETRDRSHAVS